jgi:hypothetical protein
VQWLIAIVLGILLAALLAWFNYLWLIPFGVTACAIVVFTKRNRLQRGAKILFLVLLAAAAVVLNRTGVLPVPLDERSSMDSSSFPLIGSRSSGNELVGGAGQKLSADRLTAKVARWDKDVFDPDISDALFLTQIDAWYNRADRFTRALQAKRPDLDGIRDLESAVNELRPKVQSLNQGTVTEFITKLEQYRNRLYAATDLPQADAIDAEFEKWYTTASLNETEILAGRLREVLNKVMADAASKAVAVSTTYLATLNEHESTWALDEQIRLRLPRPIAHRIDVTPLVRVSRPGAPAPTVWLSYEDSCGNEKQVTVYDFEVADQTSICVTLRTALPAEMQELKAPFRIAPFKVAKFTWPHTSAGKILISLDLESEGIPVVHPFYRTITRTEKLTELRVPKYAYFRSSLPVVPSSALSRHDVLTPAPEVTLAGIGNVNYHLVELLPDTRLIRWRWLQEHKNYFFLSNLVMPLFMMALGAFLAVLFPDPKH